MRAWRLSVAAAVAILLLAAQPARAAEFSIGQVYEGTLALNGKIRAPLLPGRWEVIGFSGNYSGSGKSHVGNVVLAQIVAGRLKAAIQVSYSEVSLSHGWHGQDRECHRTEILHARVQIDKQTVKLCDYVNHNVFSVGQKSAQWWSDGVATLTRKGSRFPASWLQAGVWASTRSDFLYIAYNFNPEFVGLPEDKDRWEMSAWNKVRIAENPQRKAFADTIAAWVDAHADAVNQAVNETWPQGKAIDWPAPFAGE